MAPVGSLNQATAYESPTHFSTSTRSESWLLPLLRSLCFHVLFHCWRFFTLTVLLRYRSPRRSNIQAASPSCTTLVLLSHNPIFTVEGAPISPAATTGITFAFFSFGY
ncbi:hypothetical protein H5410_051739 [Solanum commersonii]|uniref:Uncharacterized protein n=1 Tax=Solanum commersonii TaxID=4109 RepID=A0A9J5X1W9_SOLCO|nr:hypothetical protein H5410_051739 [Solanum commersonii]